MRDLAKNNATDIHTFLSKTAHFPHVDSQPKRQKRPFLFHCLIDKSSTDFI